MGRFVEDFGEPGLRVSQWTSKLQHWSGNCDCARAREADDADATAAGRRGDGYDGLGFVHGFSLGECESGAGLECLVTTGRTIAATAIAKSRALTTAIAKRSAVLSASLTGSASEG